MKTLHRKSVSSVVAAITSTLRQYILDPNVKILDVQDLVVTTRTFVSPSPRRLFLFRIVTSDATYVRGDTNVFKGSYRERIEAVADYLVKEVDPDASAHVEIVGPESGSPDRLVDIGALIQGGHLLPDSPLTLTARRFGLAQALVRGRHLIGPSPAVASITEAIVKREKSQTILDLFSGTGIVSRISCSVASVREIWAIEHNGQRAAGLRTDLRDERVHVICGNILDIELPEQRIDLVVADPYYEDVLAFLDRKGTWLECYADIFVLASGGAERPGWNEKVEWVIRSMGFHVDMHSEYGQTLFECKRSG